MVYSAGDEYEHPRCTVVERFKNEAKATGKHLIRCGTHVLGNGVYTESVKIKSAQYLTESTGPLRITLDGSSTTIDCGLTSGCG